MKNILLIAFVLTLTACGGGSDSSAGGASAPGQSNFTVTREFNFDNTANIAISPVTLSSRLNGRCEVNGTVTNISTNICDNVFVEFNALDENGIILSQTLDSVTSLPTNTGAVFSAAFPGGSQVVQCSDIDDIEMAITEYCD